ncbi:MAG: FxDxF family PEP-CTERM protein [Nitrosomonadales bacterium]|nr:FxDxF family PEP-CTERM protein [Nitrosomonadales bacterium]
MTKPIPSFIACAALVLAGASATPLANAASIQINTGVSAGGTTLAAGSIDPFWSISTDGINFSAAKVAYPGAYPNFNSGQTCCGMDSVSADAAWITTPSVVSTSPTTGWGISNTVYARKLFDLSGYDLGTVSLSGSWRVADTDYGIYINGNLVSGTNNHAYAFAQDQAFSLSAGSGYFVAGNNTIELRGQSVNNVWDGFWLAGTVGGQAAPITAVPEPETYAMLLAGLGLLGFTVRRRKDFTA